MSDLAALVTLELAVFKTDVVTRRSFRRFIASPRASLIVAEESGGLAGYALVLYPPRSKHARLYSIAVAPHVGGRGLGPRLLAAAESTAKRRGRQAMRLEVRVRNKRAIARYAKSGYRLFGRHRAYYDDGADALRFDKPLGDSNIPPDSAARIGFDGGQRGRRSRQSSRRGL
jgi:[ribosomal protein S18]-alanine N-acetyltransferase